jgi:hypothetical protein
MACLVAAGVSCKGEDEPAAAKVKAPSAQPPVIPPGSQLRKPGQKQGPGTVREQFAREVELPEDYPEDAPRYPGAKVNASAWRQGRVAATFSTKDTPDKVTSYVKQQLGSNGWQTTPETEFESGVLLTATKPAEGRSIQVMIATLDQGENDLVTLIAVVADPTGS